MVCPFTARAGERHSAIGVCDEERGHRQAHPQATAASSRMINAFDTGETGETGETFPTRCLYGLVVRSHEKPCSERSATRSSTTISTPSGDRRASIRLKNADLPIGIETHCLSGKKPAPEASFQLDNPDHRRHESIRIAEA